MHRLVRIFHGEVGRTGLPGDKGLPVRPQADSTPYINAAPPQVGGIGEGRAGGGECGHEGVPAISAEDRLVGVFRGKIVRSSLPSGICPSVRPQADSIPPIIAAPSEIGGIGKG